MKLEHSFTIPVPVEKAWPILLDIEQIAPCMPGAAVDSVDGDDFSGSVKVKLGPINLTYKGQAKFVEKDDSAHKAVIDARGRDSRGNGTAAAKITAQLTGKGDETECSVVTDLNITGKPAQFGRGVMVDVGNKLIGQFADCLADKLGGDDSSEADDSAAAGSAAAAGSEASAPKPSDLASSGKGAGDKASDSKAGGSTSEDKPADSKPATASGAEDKTPTGSVKVSDADKVSDRDSASAQKADPPKAPAPTPAAKPKPAPEAEPIDLLELAGGSVAKRAVPAAVGLAVIIAIIIAIVKGKKK